MRIPKTHPRYESLKSREKIEEGVRSGITSTAGLAAHGRGEAFDYLLGEKTTKQAEEAAKTAAAALLLAKRPTISVNGNSSALVPKQLARLSKILKSPLEVNVFHSSKKRVLAIKKHLLKSGAQKVLLPQKSAAVKHLESNRRYVNKEGILKADTILIPLEDGDRAEALVKSKKRVVVIDLNPLSRSSQKATITIVDNITRAMPALIKYVQKLKNKNEKTLKKTIQKYDKKKNLQQTLAQISKNLIRKQ